MSREPTDIVGSVFFDSWLDESPELRAETVIEDRHLIYEGAGVLLDILVRQIPEKSSFQVSGQIFPSTCDRVFDHVTNLSVKMEQGDKRASTQTNPLGEFMFEPVPGGSWNLMIAFKDRRLLVRGLTNQPPPTGPSVIQQLKG